MKTLLSILLSLNVLMPVKLDRYYNPTNNSGNSTYNNLAQVSYEYSVEEISTHYDISLGGFAGFEYTVPLVYMINFNINLRMPVGMCAMEIRLTTPQSSSPYYTLNYIAEGCIINNITNSFISVTLYNTDFAHIKLIYSAKMIGDMYGYTLPSQYQASWNPYEQEWIQNGYNYVHVTSSQITSVTSETYEYTTQLNNILSSVDGIESLLGSIATNSANLSNINTNIQGLQTILNQISGKLDTLENVNFTSIPVTYKGWTTDYINFNIDTYGYHSSGWYVLENPDFSSAISQGIYKLQLPLGSASSSINNIKFAQYWEEEWREWQPDIVLYYPTRNFINIYFLVSESYHQWPQSTWPLGVYVDKQMYKYSSYTFKLEYILPSNVDYWTIYNTMKQFKYMSDINTNLDQIISILGSTDITSTDSQNKQDIDNWYNNLLQDINLPTIPIQPSKLPFIQHLFQVYNEVINIPGLDIFKWFLGIQAIVMLFGVIIR